MTASEALLLASLAALPSVMDPASARVFEEPKALAARAAALLLLALAAARGLREWRSLPWRHPVIVAVGALTVLTVISAAASIQPRISWLGAYSRNHGAVTWLAIVTVFLAVAAAARDAAARMRIVAATIAGSLPPSIYALLQAAGADPFEWTWVIPGRAGSTFGNPVLLGGYLAAVIPLTASAVRTGPFTLAAVALPLQTAALLATRSRGALIALAMAAAVGVLLGAGATARRRLAIAAAAAVLIAAVAAAVAVRRTDRPTASVQVRMLIWEGAWRAFSSSGWRMTVGHGPDTFRAAWLPHAAPALARAERSDALPDRAHNDLLDALVMTGIAGTAATLAIYVAVLIGGARRLASADRILVIGLLASAAAHIVEVQVGIATMVSRLNLLVVAGVLVSLERAAPVRRPARPAVLAAAALLAALATAPALVLNPWRADRLTREAVEHERQNDVSTAIRVYLEATRLAPRQDAILTGLARAELSAGRVDDAVRTLERAAALNPRELDHPRNLARACRAARRHDCADAAYQAATAMAPRVPALWIEWAQSDVERGRYAEAAAKLDRAEALDASAAHLWLIRAHVRAAADDAAGALAAFDRELAGDPESMLALRGRAAMLVALDRRGEALAAIAELERRSPGDGIAARLRKRVER